MFPEPLLGRLVEPGAAFFLELPYLGREQVIQSFGVEYLHFHIIFVVRSPPSQFGAKAPSLERASLIRRE
jgi:hypothetical protein